MGVDGVESSQHLSEMLTPDGHHEREADGRVVGVASAHPVPEPEHVVGVDAEFLHARLVGRHGDEVLGHRALVARGAQAVQQPVPGRGGIGQGLEGGEGLGADHEEGGGRIEVVGRRVQVDRVDIGDEPADQIGRGVVGQGLGGHGRSQVRAANADVDDGPDALPGGTDPGTGADAVGEIPHSAQHGVHVAGDILAVHREPFPFGQAQRDMEDGPVLGGVDVIAGEHGVAAGLHPGGSGHAQQEPHRLVGDAVLGVIEHQIASAGSEAGGPLGVASEELAQVPVTHVAEVRFERLPLGRGGEIHVGHSRGGGCRSTALDGRFTGSLRPPESPVGRMPPPGSKPWHFAR